MVGSRAVFHDVRPVFEQRSLLILAAHASVGEGTRECSLGTRAPAVIWYSGVAIGQPVARWQANRFQTRSASSRSECVWFGASCCVDAVLCLFDGWLLSLQRCVMCPAQPIAGRQSRGPGDHTVLLGQQP